MDFVQFFTLECTTYTVCTMYNAASVHSSVHGGHTNQRNHTHHHHLLLLLPLWGHGISIVRTISMTLYAD